MNLTSREKTTVLVGAVGGGAILLVAFVLVPLGQWWSDTGLMLEPKLRRIEQLKQKAAQRQDFLKRREALVRDMGTLAGPEEATGRQHTGPKTSESQAKAAPQSAEVKEKPPPGGAAAASEGVEAGGTPTAAVPKTGDDKPAPPAKASGTNDKPAVTPNLTAAPEKAPDQSPPPKAGQTEAPARPPSACLAAYVERAAGRSGVSLKAVTPKDRPGDAGRTKHFRAATVRVTLDCGLQGLIKFLHALEKGERYTRVDRLELRRDPKKDDAITATLDIAGYQLAEP